MTSIENDFSNIDLSTLKVQLPFFEIVKKDSENNKAHSTYSYQNPLCSTFNFKIPHIPLTTKAPTTVSSTATYSPPDSPISMGEASSNNIGKVQRGRKRKVETTITPESIAHATTTTAASSSNVASASKKLVISRHSDKQPATPLTRSASVENMNAYTASVTTTGQLQHEMTDSFRRQCNNIINSLMKHDYAFPFNVAVDPVALNIPDYFHVIKSPMDFGTIKQNLKQDVYETAEEFCGDVELVFRNAMIYNPPDHDVHLMAKTLKKYFRQLMQRHLPTVTSKPRKTTTAKTAMSSTSSDEHTTIVHAPSPQLPTISGPTTSGSQILKIKLTKSDKKIKKEKKEKKEKKDKKDKKEKKKKKEKQQQQELVAGDIIISSESTPSISTDTTARTTALQSTQEEHTSTIPSSDNNQISIVESTENVQQSPEEINNTIQNSNEELINSDNTNTLQQTSTTTTTSPEESNDAIQNSNGEMQQTTTPLEDINP